MPSLEHDPEPKDRVSEKWEPLFGKDHGQTESYPTGMTSTACSPVWLPVVLSTPMMGATSE
jgi:hypothetical protein